MISGLNKIVFRLNLFCAFVCWNILFFSASNVLACTGGVAGQMLYNSTQKVMQYCDGTNWIAMNKPGSGSGGCTTPTTPEGSIVFNASFRVNQVCAGNVYRAMGPRLSPNSASSGAGNAERFVKMDSGSSHTCGIKENGTLWCWGSDSGGELGDGNPAADSATPVEVSGGGTWIDISTGNGNGPGGTCAVKSDGTLWCWGQAWGNCCGVQSTPVDRSSSQTWKAVALGGWENVCAIRSDDTLWCRGWNLGNGGTPATSSTFVAVSGGQTWKKIAVVSSGHAFCAIRSDDTLWCWGSGDLLGQPGTGTPNSNVPLQVGADTWKFIEGNFGHDTGQSARFCGIKSDDTAWCWGSDTGDWLGNGGGDNSGIEPRVVLGGATWKYLASGYGFTCGIRTDNSLWCWGVNSAGQLGDGTTTQQTTPVNIQPGTSWAIISAGGNSAGQDWSRGFTCGVRLDGGRYCWGQNDRSQLGNVVTLSSVTIPTPIDDKGNFLQIAGGGGSFCGIKADATLWCWGDDGYGVLGNGASGSSSQPSQVTGGGTWKTVMVGFGGSNHACGIKTDDTLWCWGSDVRAQLGNGATTANQQSPVQIGADTWKVVTGGGDFNGEGWTCGIKTDDTLWCWGKAGTATWDARGIATTADQNVPLQVAVGTTWKNVVAGWHSTCGIRSDDTLWCWGRDDNGVLGNGASGDTTLPVQIGAATWTDVTTNTRVACGIQAGGARYCWGGGIGSSPVLVSDGGGWSDFEYETELFGGLICATKTNQTLWCFTTNGSATEVIGSGSWIDLAMTSNQQCAIRVGGQVHCWGSPGNALGFSYNSTAVNPTIGSCSNPATQAGGLRYHAASNAMIYCDGTGFRTIGK
jgi:alpha-tubulin suppressor-like RCC1 family protein